MIELYDVYVGGKVVETALKADSVTKDLLDKYEGQAGLMIKIRREEEEMVVVGGECVGGNCPVKVAPASSATAKKAVATAKKAAKVVVEDKA